MKFGIDKIAFYIPNRYLDLTTLANNRNIDPNKYIKGLLQEQMRLAPIWHDCVSLGANAAYKIIDQENIDKIDLVLFATESAVDQSKAAAIFVHKLLGLKPEAHAVEIKQACYGATFALKTAIGHLTLNPDSHVLVIASDIAKYGLNSSGESTQGAGAVAMIIKANPSILIYDNKQTFKTEDIYDFWRPNHLDYALVDGHFSNQKYQELFLDVYQSYLTKYQATINDFSAICFHLPYGKLALNSLKLIADATNNETLYQNLEKATIYNKKVGNIYNGSLYLSLISLLENGLLKPNSKIGLYSYGSGAVAEFFSLTLAPDYKNFLKANYHQRLLNNGISLTFTEYEQIIKQNINTHESSQFEIINDDDTVFYLKEIKEQKRIYQKRK